ncbi:sensor histidine kinase [Paenibacillus nasutitermitis]|uniref:Histidine kinase n=1 Tax=Paenibacillus nasutitermitis TaxID=1652958 RepID=A0A916ZGQ2_9BACL|nr:PocR ligand-binding domain-containing protein [Paenibacillus nasutitermitis]GGD96724.1 hypothetical protein GCM10010911_64380 [Paenibacillus nasutitermitis]
MVEEELLREMLDEMLSKKRSVEQNQNELIDMDLYIRLQETFMAATGLNANVVNSMGISMTPEPQERSPRFCQLVHSVPVGKERCIQCDLMVTNAAISMEKAVIRRCHAGLYDCAVPIQFNQQGIGSFITGQVLLEAPTDEMVEDILHRVADLQLDREELRQAIHEIPQISKERLFANTDFITILVDYIIKNLKENEFKRQEAELRYLLSEAEMKAVQSKLHPHLLFNVLNLISGQALLENASRTHSIVAQLSKMLRYMLKSYRPLITVGEELEYLDPYIKLQCLRFEDRLSYSVHYEDPSLQQYRIPSLTIQILIENAIKHGIEPKEGPCFIRTHIYSEADRLVIEVRDNGVGLTGERVKKIIPSGEGMEEQFSGIMMIRKRLEYYYRDNFAFDIQSTEGEGTLVKISCPKITENPRK